jgi:hypothetical protein
MARLAGSAFALAIVATVAHADEPKETVEAREDVDSAPQDEDAPILRFDASLFGVGIERYDEQITELALTPSFEVSTRVAWQRALDPMAIARGESELVRGWRAGVAASYAGWARITAHGTYEHVENELSRAAHVSVGVDVTRTFRVSKNVTGFVSLSLGHIKWRGTPPLGAFDATRAMLSAGFRWK